jgi:hypothetical protein
MIFRLLLLLLLGALLFTGVSEAQTAPKPFDPVEAAKQGRALVAEILSQRPPQNFTNAGVLKIRDPKGKRSEIPVQFEALSTATNWMSAYHAASGKNIFALTVIHADGQANEYHLNETIREMYSNRSLAGNQTMTPYASSDFWVADLGLEFFRWPEQRILKSELRKSRLCRVLESINPQPATNAYSRVVSWIDDESLGIVHADAYDVQNKLLKEFDAKKIKKIKGEWQLEEMEINNVQTGSRTQIEFSFDSK